jgi:hypothetical protein
MRIDVANDLTGNAGTMQRSLIVAPTIVSRRRRCHHAWAIIIRKCVGILAVLTLYFGCAAVAHAGSAPKELYGKSIIVER